MEHRRGGGNVIVVKLVYFVIIKSQADFDFIVLAAQLISCMVLGKPSWNGRQGGETLLHFMLYASTLGTFPRSPHFVDDYDYPDIYGTCQREWSSCDQLARLTNQRPGSRFFVAAVTFILCH